jgi:predicted DNA-binding protein (UPF0251 family)
MNESFNIHDYTLRNFVGLFITDETVRRYVNVYRRKYIVREQLYETSKKVSYILSQYGYEEMRAETIAVILEMAKCYKDKNKPSFHNYVDKCFYKWFWWKTERYFSDPVAKSKVRYEEEFEKDERSEVRFNMAIDVIDWYYQSTNFLKDSRLKPKICKNPFNNAIFDISWIDGYTCSKSFKTLTSFERKILKLYYIDKLKDQDIGEQCGVCRATINRRRMAAQRKLEAVINGQEEGSEGQDYNMQEVR